MKKRLLLICAVAGLLLTANAIASYSQSNGTPEPGPADPQMPLDGTWVRLIEPMAADDFFTGNYTWDSPVPADFTMLPIGEVGPLWFYVNSFYFADSDTLAVGVYNAKIYTAVFDLTIWDPWWRQFLLGKSVTVLFNQTKYMYFSGWSSAGAYRIEAYDIRSGEDLWSSAYIGSVNYVPEPSTICCLVGLGGLMLTRRRKGKAN